MAFSENFESIKEFAAGAAQSAAKKTRQLATIAKANIAILGEEEKIKKAQLELGKLYYKDFIIEEEPDEAEYLPWCDKVTDCMKNIEKLKAEIEAMRAGDTETTDAAAEPESDAAEIVIEVQPEEAAASEEPDETKSEEPPIEIIVDPENTEE